MITLLKKAIKHQKENIAHFEKGKSNPQTFEMLLIAQGRLEALEDCLLAARGDTFNLRLMGRDCTETPVL